MANETTVGLPEASASSSEMPCIRQTGSRVQILAMARELVATGLGPERALAPTGAGTRRLTLTLPWPAARWLATSTMATPSHSPGSGRSIRAT